MMEVLDVETICRTCLSASSDSFELLYSEEEDSNFYNLMKTIFQANFLPISVDLQHRICLECQEIIRKAHKFKQSCVLANIEFNELNYLANTEDKHTQTERVNPSSNKKTRTVDLVRNDEDIQFDDENFDSINLQSEDSIFDNQMNPLLEMNPTSSNPVRVKTEQSELSEEEYESVGNEEEDDEDAEIGNEQDSSLIIKTEDEDLVCDVNPFTNGDDESQEKVDGKYKVHKCTQCSKCFSRATHLKRHELIHEEGRLSCTVCDKRFTRLDHLNLHIASNHSETKPFQCEVPECKKGFVRQEQLKRHIEAKHGDATKQKETCTICQKTFTSKKYLRMHMKSCNGNGSGLTCKYCGKDFADKTELNDHMAKDHQNEKPYLCSECGLRFVRNDYLVIHMRRHMGVKPYKCRFCEKGFPRATDLTVHERYHTNEKTHLCNQCGKGFQRAYNLLVHMRVHTGEKPYQCSFCNKSFSQGNDLKAHIRRHTGERFKCDLCSEGFIQGYHLTHHKRTVHGLDVKSHIRRVEKFVAPVTSNQGEEKLEDEDVKMEYSTIQFVQHPDT